MEWLDSEYITTYIIGVQQVESLPKNNDNNPNKNAPTKDYTTIRCIIYTYLE